MNGIATEIWTMLTQLGTTLVLANGMTIEAAAAELSSNNGLSMKQEENLVKKIRKALK